MMRLKFLGAAGTVTGSKYLLRSDRGAILVDCGLFQGLKQLRLRNREALGFDPRTLDAVVLTHAHIDHSGYLPLLVKQGFSGPIYCTSGTRDLLGVLLPDSGRLQEEEAESANRHRYSRHAPALPLYTEEDARRTLPFAEAVEFDEPIDVGAGMEARFLPAGHILGAAMAHVGHEDESILFSGDLGRSDDPIMYPPAAAPEADYLVVESTYGDRLHPAHDPLVDLAAVVNRTIGRGGAIVVPTFAVGRAQLLVWMLHQLRSAGRIPSVPTYLDSPMATDASDIYRRHAGDHRLSRREYADMFADVRIVNSIEESKALDLRTGGRIILAASGMLTGGRVLHHLRALAGDQRNTVLLTGFQSAGTRGAALLAGEREIKMHGEYLAVRAEVAQLDSLSAHADQRELLDWLSAIRRAPKRTYITHGEPVAADALRRRIEERLGWDVCVAEHRQTIPLDARVAADES